MHDNQTPDSRGVLMTASRITTTMHDNRVYRVETEYDTNGSLVVSVMSYLNLAGDTLTDATYVCGLGEYPGHDLYKLRMAHAIADRLNGGVGLPCAIPTLAVAS